MNKLKFNVFDTIIIILAISALLGSAFYTYSRQISMMFVKSTDAVITLTMQAPNKVFADTISDDNYLYLAKEDSKLGSILSIVNRRNSKEVLMDDGSIETVYTDDSYTVIIRISTKIKENDKGMFVNSNTFIAKGKILNVMTKIGNVECTVEKIETE